MTDEPTQNATAPEAPAHASNLAEVESELDKLQQSVQAITEQRETDTKTILSTLQRLEASLTASQAQTAQAEQPEAVAHWRVAQHRARDLILLLLGATASAFYQTVIQEEVYPALKARLQELLRTVDAAPGLPEGVAPIPHPQPMPTPNATRVPAQPRTPEPPQALSHTEHGPLQFDWVTIPAGWFLMGSDERKDKDAWRWELPQHRVYLPEYRISRVPVTVWQFSRFCEAVPYRTDAEGAWDTRTWTRVSPGIEAVKHKLQHPVTFITWRDAQRFCHWAGVRLPTEAEWEKAARGTDGRIYPWGNQPPTEKLCNFGWSVNDTTPVDRYPDGASPYGLLDMAGNVCEWTSSLYKPYPYRADDGREDPANSGKRVTRGGSFWLDPKMVLRCASRMELLPGPGKWAELCGFRVVSPGF